MNEWIGVLLPIAVAAAITIIPGHVTVRILGFRGLFAWALAAPVSVPIVAGASLVAPLAGITWSIAPVLVMTAISCLVALALRLSLKKCFVRTDAIRPAGSGATIIGLGLAGVLIAAQFLLITGDPDNISQTFDNIFHLNAARYILDTGNASPLSVSQLTQSGATGLTFYPALWHGLVALVAQSTGASVAVASNAVMIAVGAVVWPASVMALGVTVFGRTRAYVIAVGILAASAPAFPILMIDYGVLFPYFLAVSTLPAIIAATLALLKLVDRTPWTNWGPWLIVLLPAVPGLLLVHPSAFIGWVLLAMISAAIAFARFVGSGAARRSLWIAGIGLAFATVAALVVWRTLRPPVPEDIWPPSQTPGQAIGEVLTMSMERAQIPIALAIALLAGLVIAWRRGTAGPRVAVILLVVLDILFVVTSSMQWLWLRHDIAAGWYNNSPRLAALIPIMAVPIAAVTIEAIWRWLVRRAPDRYTTRGTPAYATLVVVSCIALVAATQLIAIPGAIQRARYVYIPSEASPLLTADEFAMLQQLPELLPADAVVAGNPGTGTAMAYAISGIDVLHPAVIISMNEDIALIDNEANEATPGSPVCDAMNRTGVTHILDFGTQQINGENYRYPGFEDLDRSDAVVLIEEIGDARLYEVTGCERD